MDLVLGLSITSAALRVVLVEGATGEGATVDRHARDIATIHTIGTDNPDHLVDAVLGKEAIAAARDNRLRAIGVTWTKAAEAAASIVIDALVASDLKNVIAVSELESAGALARGIANLGGYDDLAVCVVEPDAAVIAIVKPDGVVTDGVDRPLDGADADEFARSLITALDLHTCDPDAIFAVGSADDLDLIVSSLDAAAASSVVSAAKADLALARGAALASAHAVYGPEAAVVDDHTADSGASRMPWLTSRVAALVSILVAAMLTFVVSLSVALGIDLTPDAGPGTAEQRQVKNVPSAPPSVATAPSVAQVAPLPAPPAAPPPEVAPPPADTIAAAEAPAPAPEVAPDSEPVFEPPEAAPVAPPPVYEPIAPPPVAPPPAPAYVPPPPPAYVPPAPPVYVPPAPAPNYLPPGVPAYVPPVPNPAPKPRLRDRIIERIPIINRFHEPELPYP